MCQNCALSVITANHQALTLLHQKYNILYLVRDQQSENQTTEQNNQITWIQDRVLDKSSKSESQEQTPNIFFRGKNQR